MADDTSLPPLTRASAASLLRSDAPAEEDSHPWDLEFSVDPDKPLLRVWDKWSGSIPEESGRMLSRAPRERLDTLEARKEFLTIHADHAIWEPTPFISFTQSPQELQDTAEWREPKRKRQQLTVLNPNVRIEDGFPILNMHAEMCYYGIADPYHKNHAYYRNHCVCVWKIKEEEIVGQWEWDDLREMDDWYERVILPAFKRHNEKYRASIGDLDMSALWDALLEAEAFSIETHSETKPVFTYSITREGDESKVWSGEESDSYDEVEESNALDDALNGFGED